MVALVGGELGASSFVAEIAFDVEARCCPGLFAEGRDRLEVTVEAGALMMAEVYEAADESAFACSLVQHLSDQLGGRPPSVPLGALLVSASCLGHRFAWWFKQLVVIVGLAIDNFLPNQHHPQDPLAADARVPTGKWRDPLLADCLQRNHPGASHSAIERVGRAHGVMGRWAARHQHLIGVKYFLASRQWFGGCRIMCCAIDSARFGNRQTQHGLVLGRRH